MKNIRIDFVSDVACPWCAIGLGSLEQALEELNKDREFLTRGGVFSDSMLDAYVELKMQEVQRMRVTTHPAEFDMYYSL